MPTFWRMNEKPTAVISGASFGALRNGRYPTRSIIALRTPQTTIVMTSTTSRPAARPITGLPVVRPTVP